MFGLFYLERGDLLLVKKVFNNNILLAQDQDLLEVILMGKGIGFGLKPGDKPDQGKVDKVFKIASEELQNQFVKIVNDIPANHLDLTEKVLNYAQDQLKVKFDDSTYIGLADHLNYAIKRARDGNELKNALSWEIRKFYKDEYKVAIETLEIIKYHEQISLSEDEASFIAMHFVNGQQNGSGVKDAIITTKIIQDILSIVKFHFDIDLDEDSINYVRFVTHIRFFLQRIDSDARAKDDFLFDQVKMKYPEVYDCVERISLYFNKKLNIDLSSEEMLYFMLHIRRLIERKN